jgi:hypothetical protein
MVTFKIEEADNGFGANDIEEQNPYRIVTKDKGNMYNGAVAIRYNMRITAFTKDGMMLNFDINSWDEEYAFFPIKSVKICISKS